MYPYKFINTPFASGSGADLVPIPDSEQPNGDISFNQGFTPDYELDLISGSPAKAIPRPQTNQLYNYITEILKQYQVWGTPNFIDPSQTIDSLPYLYPKWSKALQLRDGLILPFKTLAETNTDPAINNKFWTLDDGTSNSVSQAAAVFDENVNKGDIVYWNPSSNTYNQALANGAFAQNAIGIADLTNGRVIQFGNCALFSGLSKGDLYYLSITTPGAITNLKPGLNAVQVGIALSDTVLFFSIIPASSPFTPGMKIGFTGLLANIPAGFIVPDGSEQLTASYPALSALYGGQNGLWGTASTSNRFVLPNYLSRSAIGGGVGSAPPGLTIYEIGEFGGAEQYTQPKTSLATHDHLYQLNGNPITVYSPPSGTLNNPGGGSGRLQALGPSVQVEGGGQPFSIRNPFVVELPILKF